VYVPAAGDPETWAVPGPFLGTAETAYQLVRGRLAPGDRLVIGSDGTRPDGDRAAGTGPDSLLDAAVRHRDRSGQAFVDAVARDLLPHVRHPDDITLMAVEMTAGGS
jgi:sigma-B regulation protein RsbU (phosphoserine phosphatase)